MTTRDEPTRDHPNNDDDLTIDGTDLLVQILDTLQTGRQTPPAVESRPVDEITITEPPPVGGRWTPPTPLPPGLPAAEHVGGVSRVQVGVVIGTFAFGAILALMIGLSHGATDASDAGSLPPITVTATGAEGP